VEDDTLKAVSMVGYVQVPMPVGVIAGIHASGEPVELPTLSALRRDDGQVATLMLRTGAGSFIRHAGRWHLLQDEGALKGFSRMEVPASSLKLFDRRSKSGSPLYVPELDQATLWSSP
jgi:hypothetical protein